MDQERHQANPGSHQGQPGRPRDRRASSASDGASRQSADPLPGGIPVPIRPQQSATRRARATATSGSGDVLGGVGGRAQGPAGKGAGDEPGVDYFEAEVTDGGDGGAAFRGLDLPNLRAQKDARAHQRATRCRDMRTTGITSQHRQEAHAAGSDQTQRAWPGRSPAGIIAGKTCASRPGRQSPHEANAVVLAMMDTSGSMGTFENTSPAASSSGWCVSAHPLPTRQASYFSPTTPGAGK